MLKRVQYETVLSDTPHSGRKRVRILMETFSPVVLVSLNPGFAGTGHFQLLVFSSSNALMGGIHGVRSQNAPKCNPGLIP